MRELFLQFTMWTLVTSFFVNLLLLSTASSCLYHIHPEIPLKSEFSSKFKELMSFDFHIFAIKNEVPQPNHRPNDDHFATICCTVIWCYLGGRLQPPFVSILNSLSSLAIQRFPIPRLELRILPSPNLVREHKKIDEMGEKTSRSTD